MMFYIEIVGLDGAGKSSLARSLVYKLGDRACLISVSMAKITRAFTYMSAHSEAYDIIASDIDAGIDYLIGDRGYACFYAYQHKAGSEVIDRLSEVIDRLSEV